MPAPKDGSAVAVAEAPPRVSRTVVMAPSPKKARRTLAIRHATGDRIVALVEILSTSNKHMLLPEKDFEGFQRPAPTIRRSPGHYQEWIEACKTGKPTSADFQYSGWLTEANHLGNVAYRTGKKLEWDAANLRATNAPAADRIIRREYRSGWEL